MTDARRILHNPTIPRAPHSLAISRILVKSDNNNALRKDSADLLIFSFSSLMTALTIPIKRFASCSERKVFARGKLGQDLSF
ncbi:9748_t:CDS:2 [Entrophospora sp. SA101]|nr:9748_t:CDS:2 [Entrophospora sp. SA101]